MEKQFQEALEAIGNAEKLALMSHDRPDGDAIGSLVGLGLMLERAGKTVELLNQDAVPRALSFLPETQRVKRPPKQGTIEVDLIIALDSAGKDRISEQVWNALPSNCPVINIDHHVSNTGYGDINVVDTVAPATGEIVYHLAESAGWPITRDVAENLFAAISTDTGSFRYPNTTSATYRAAAGLIDAGIDLGKINQQLYESFPVTRVECIRDLLQDMRICFDGRCATVKLTRKLKQELQLNPTDTEGVVDIIRAIDTVIVAVFFEEVDEGKIRVSSRSKDPAVNVSKICAVFGGGGHDLAAGARIRGEIEEVESRFLAEVEKALPDQS